MHNSQFSIFNSQFFPALRERLALLLIVLLPFHAFLVTVLTRLIAGPGQAPLRMLTVWKEGVLALICGLAIVEYIQSKKRTLTIDALDWCVFALAILAPAVSFGLNDVPLKQFVYGAKYDLLPLVAFVVLRRVDWSEWFRASVLRWLPIIGAVIVAWGIATLFLPQSFFTALGYSDLHSLYVADNSLAAFQQVMGTAWRRMQSVMSGPNQLGLWLLIPWGGWLGGREKMPDLTFRISGFALATGILLTFSRSAWIAAAVMMGVIVWQQRIRLIGCVRTTWVMAVAGICVLIAVIAGTVAFPQAIARAGSSKEHLRKPMQAMSMMFAHPLGMGLGTAGPASNAVSDTCVMLDAGADASWAKDRPDLCVFVGESQVQPSAPCNCPVLTENWYLQIGVELGVLGFVFFVTLTLLVLRRLAVSGKRIAGSARSAFLVFLGISIAGLFLHSWEDSAVGYMAWILIAAVVPVATKQLYPLPSTR